MPIYFFVVRNQKVKTPVKVVVAIPDGITKIKFRTSLWDGTYKRTCATSASRVEQRHRVDRVVALFWDSGGTLITQTTVTVDGTEINVPSNAAYAEWRVPPNAVFTVDLDVSYERAASVSATIPVMSFIDQAGNVTDIYINLVFICSGWEQPISVTSAELPINIDIPFCHDCGGDFSYRSALRGIYAVVKNAQNASLRAILLDSTKTGLVDCSWVNVGDVSQETVFILCDETDTDLLANLKMNYPVTRYIRVMIDRANPTGPFPAAMFSIYFTVDKGSIP